MGNVEYICRIVLKKWHVCNVCLVLDDGQPRGSAHLY